MNRLRREFETYTPKSGFDERTSRSTSHTTRSSTHPSSGAGTFGSGTGGGTLGSGTSGIIRHYDPYLENIKSPLIREESDGKTLRLRFDVSQYKPEEVTVKTVDNRLLVHAKHEEKVPQRTVYREYNQEFMLPQNTNPELITSTLSVDGVLTVESPLPVLVGGLQRYPISFFCFFC